MKQELIDAVCQQINMEFYSAYLYYAMSSWAEHHNWKGLAKWLKVQQQEENVHGDVLYNHLVERGARVIFQAIDQPDAQWDSPRHVFEAVCAHEAVVTDRINHLASLALAGNDHTFYQFIQAFLREQIEEESSAGDILARLQRLDGHPELIDAIDRELGTRVFTDPFPGLSGATAAP